MDPAFISDTHFGHGNIIKYCRRPFTSPEEDALLKQVDEGLLPTEHVQMSEESIDWMDETILYNINQKVPRNGILWHLGDFCMAKGKKAHEKARYYRDMINCQTVNIIWGNHDDKKALRGLFNEAHDHHTISVGDQKIFLDHYPNRRWDKSHRGSWMLYGHVHGHLSHEDEGILPHYQRKWLDEEFHNVVRYFSLPTVDQQPMVNDLLKAVQDVMLGYFLTLDVGVDRKHRFAPWTTPELRRHFETILPKRQEHDRRSREHVPLSQQKAKHQNLPEEVVQKLITP